MNPFRKKLFITILLFISWGYFGPVPSTAAVTRTSPPPAPAKTPVATPSITPPAVTPSVSSQIPVSPTTTTPPAKQISPAVSTMGMIKGTITGNVDGKSVVQWFGGTCDNIRIDLLDGSFKLVNSLRGVPFDNGCSFQGLVNQPKSLSIQAPATFGNNEFKWQYYQQWTSSDNNNTTNIVLKQADHKMMQMAVNPPDIHIKAINTYPHNLSDVDMPDIRATLQNKGGLPGSRNIYYRCVPLNTPTCGNQTNAQGILSIEVTVPAGSEVEKGLFGWYTSVLLNGLLPGQYEIVAGLTQGLGDNTVMKKKFTVSNRPLTVYEIWPQSLTVGDIYKTVELKGDKFTPQSVVLMQAGSGSKIELQSYVPPGTNQSKPTAIAGKIPNGIGDHQGYYYFWVKNPNGQLSNSVELKVGPAYTDPPIIKDYYPRVIKKWNFDPYNNRVSFPIPNFIGEGLDLNRIKIVASVVESSTAVGPVSVASNMTLTMPGYNYLKKGVIELTVYRSDPAKGVKVRLPVDTEIPIVGPPVIVSPTENEMFLSKDVSLRIDSPVGVTSRKFRLRWEWEPTWAFSYRDVTILDTVDLTNTGAQGIKISKDLFPGEGRFRVRARVAEVEGATTANDWSKEVMFQMMMH